MLSDFGYSVSAALTKPGKRRCRNADRIRVSYVPLGFPNRHCKGIINKQYIHLRYNFCPPEQKSIQTGQDKIFFKADISLILPKNRTSVRASTCESIENQKQGISLPLPWGQATITK